MSSERPTKKARVFSDATVPAVSGGGIHFTPELIARITTFADAIKCPDVMNICLAVGPVVSRTVKHFYLWRNEKYLVDTLKCLAGFYYDTSDAGTNHRAWMEVNADWKTTAVSDDSVSGMSQLNLQHIIVIGSHPYIAFNSAALAVELGLLEVVKFLIEDKGVDPNEYGLTLTNHFDDRVHLVSAAITFEHEAIFKYLLSLPSTNLYSEIDDNLARSGYHGVFEQALDNYLVHNGAKTYLTSIVNHNRFDVNQACHRCSTFPTCNFTCLYIALKRLDDFLDADSKRLDRYIDVIKLLLEAGANPNQNVSGVRNVIDLIETWLLAMRANVRQYSNPLRIERVYGQVLAMMREPRAL